MDFGVRLKAARIMSGLSMDALVQKMGNKLSKQSISKYENGQMNPDSTSLILLAESLNVSVDYFFSEHRVVLSDVNFRKHSSLGKRAVESLKERIRDQVERYLELEVLLGIQPRFVNPLQTNQISNSYGVELAANQLRSEWGIGPDISINSLFVLLEDKGVIVIEVDEDEKFDGLSAWVSGIPVVVVNKNRSTDRRRLTILHELAHLILHFSSELSESFQEKLCHGFGGAFLLPETVLKNTLGEQRTSLSFEELKNLKQQYGISMQAIMFRAKSHGIISENYYEKVSKTFSMRGWRKNEPVEYLGEEGTRRFDQLLFRALAEGVISFSKAAYLSHLDMNEIKIRLELPDENTPA